MHIQNRRQARHMISRAKAAYYSAIAEAQDALNCGDLDWYESAYEASNRLHAEAEKVMKECGVSAKFNGSLIWASSLDKDYLRETYNLVLPKIAYA